MPVHAVVVYELKAWANSGKSGQLNGVLGQDWVIFIYLFIYWLIISANDVRCLRTLSSELPRGSLFLKLLHVCASARRAMGNPIQCAIAPRSKLRTLYSYVSLTEVRENEDHFLRSVFIPR